jgi:hypothetical protein
VLPEVWERFLQQKETLEAKQKSQQFIELARRNQHHHNMGMTGYAGKRLRWRAEERALAEAKQEDPYSNYDERARDFLKGRMPKKLKEGKTKFNDPRIEEAEKRILAVTTAAERGEFEPRRERDVQTEMLGNPEHRGRVCGLGSRKS